jgi:molybdate transport system ATP-binding protein
MTCRPLARPSKTLVRDETHDSVTLEIPFTRVWHGAPVRIAIRAGDIILATVRPEKLSARNILPGHVTEIRRTGTRVTVTVDCGGVKFLAHVTTGAVESLELRTGCAVWVVIKSYSCQLLAPSGRAE